MNTTTLSSFQASENLLLDNHDVDDVVRYLGFLSKSTGYAFVSDKKAAEFFDVSVSQWQRRLKKAREEGRVQSVHIGRGRGRGTQRLLFVDQAIAVKDQILTISKPRSTIGKKKVMAYENPEIKKILANATVLSGPIIYPNSALLFSHDAQSNAQSNAQSYSRELYIYTKDTKKEVVYRQNSDSKKSPPSFKKKSFQRQVLSFDENQALVRSYGEKIVNLCIANYNACASRVEKDGNTDGVWYKRPIFQVINEWAKEKFEKEVRVRQKIARAEEGRKEMTIDATIAERRKKAKENSLVMKYCRYNPKNQSLFVVESPLSEEQKKEIYIHGLMLGESNSDCDDYRTRFEKFLCQLERVDGKRPIVR